jgi:hypothetical protein
MTKIYWDVEQGSAKWYRLRSGIPTASDFDNIITPTGKECTAEKRKKYMANLMAQRILLWQPDSLDKLDNIRNGKEMEPSAVIQYEEIESEKTGLVVRTRKVGFMTTNDGRAGASPDRIIIDQPRCLEVKCPTVPVHFYYLAFGHAPEYTPQVQGQLYVADQEFGQQGDFISFQTLCPPWITETKRDEAFIGKLHDYLGRFLDELDEVTFRVRSMGAFQPFASIATPLDAELGEELRHTPLGDDLPQAINSMIDRSSPLPPDYDWG